MPQRPNPEKMRLWLRRLEQFESSGLTVREFCAQEGVSQPAFYQWRRKLTQAGWWDGSPKAVKERAPKFRDGADAADRGEPSGSGSIGIPAQQGAFQTFAWRAPSGEPAATVRLPNGVQIDLADGRSLMEGLLQHWIGVPQVDNGQSVEDRSC